MASIVFYKSDFANPSFFEGLLEALKLPEDTTIIDMEIRSAKKGVPK